MTIEQFVAVLKGVTELLGVLAWPAVFVFVLTHFGGPLREFFSSMGELTLKGAGFEASAKRRQVEAAASIGAALGKSAASRDPAERSGGEPTASPELIADAVSPRLMRRLKSAGAILWVDDRPANNTYERQALEALGARIVLSTSTEDALEKTRLRRFDVIISDMGRPPDSDAGYTLLDELRKRRDPTPFIIYASSNDAKYREMARERGALGSTNRADELMLLVLEALADNQPR